MNRAGLILSGAVLISTSLLFPGRAFGAGSHPEDLRPCSESDFTVSRFLDALPVDLATVSGLVPLGNTNGTSHILPISTTYFYTPFAFGGADGHQMIPAVAGVPIRIPGDATITALRWEPNSGGALVAGDDWYVNFRPCREIRFTYHHLNAITGPPELVARAAQIRRGIRAWCTHAASGGRGRSEPLRAHLCPAHRRAHGGRTGSQGAHPGALRRARPVAHPRALPARLFHGRGPRRPVCEARQL